MRNLNVLIVAGYEGRGSALFWKLNQSSQIGKLLVTPGNAGIPAYHRRRKSVLDFDGIVRLARLEQIDLVVVSPEAPLVGGLVDRLSAAGIRACGPTAAAARLEGDKAFMKRVCVAAGIPTAAHIETSDLTEAVRAIKKRGFRVIKEAGLAAGKGVVVANSEAAAIAAAEHFLRSSNTLVLEECLSGPEVSVHVICAKQHAKMLISARDYKRRSASLDAPNTGGMGAYAPASGVSPELLCQIEDTIVTPLLRYMDESGMPVCGVLKIDLMLTASGPMVLEINVRFGDPETQVILPLMESDLLEYLYATTFPDELARLPAVQFRPEAAVCITAVVREYPDAHRVGQLVEREAMFLPPDNVVVFHAGTERNKNGRVVVAGGRVLNFVATAPVIAHAQDDARAEYERWNFDSKDRRHDIALEVE